MLESIIQRNIILISFGILVIFLLLVDTAGYNIKIQYGETQEYGQAVPPISGVMVTSKEAGEVSVEEVANDKYLYGSIHTSQWIRNDNHIDIILQRHFTEYGNKYNFCSRLVNICSIKSTILMKSC